MTKAKPSLNVVQFDLPKADPDVVAEIERLLADARSGKLRAIAYAVHTVNDQGADCTRAANLGFGNRVNMIGRVRMLEHVLATDFLQHLEEDDDE